MILYVNILTNGQMDFSSNANIKTKRFFTCFMQNSKEIQILFFKCVVKDANGIKLT